MWWITVMDNRASPINYRTLRWANRHSSRLVGKSTPSLWATDGFRKTRHSFQKIVHEFAHQRLELSKFLLINWLLAHRLTIGRRYWFSFYRNCFPLNWDAGRNLVLSGFDPKEEFGQCSVFSELVLHFELVISTLPGWSGYGIGIVLIFIIACYWSDR